MLSVLQNQLPIMVSKTYLIRLVDADDKKDIFEMYSNEKVARYVARKTHETLEDTEQFIELVMQRMKEGNNIYLGVYHIKAAKVIGIIRLLRKDEPDVLTIGYALNEGYWGQAIIPKCMERLIDIIKSDRCYSKLRATVRPENINSQRCLEKLGFELSGSFLKEETIGNIEAETERFLYFKKLH